MAVDRTAISTIIGYYYQFDFTILKMLELTNDSDTICIEGIEDVDINNSDEMTAIQCKYYEKTEYNHSVIAKPIRLMLKHYANIVSTSSSKISYRIYGYYSSGQDKLPPDIDISFLKEKFLTFTEKGEKRELHIELGLSDHDISDFLSRLNIDINAISIENQEKEIIKKIKRIFSCNDFDANHYYYNSALRVIKDISTDHDVANRTISKRDFIAMINNKDVLFNLWYIKKKGIKPYCQSLKRQYFSIHNVSPYERLFLIEFDQHITNSDLKAILLNIAKKWSKLSRRETKPFCPYIYLHNISEQSITDIKKALQADNVYFLDGYDFKNADFCAKSICKKATASNEVKFKFINQISQIDCIINSISATREIYQFYISEPYYTNSNHTHIKMQIEETKNINDII